MSLHNKASKNSKLTVITPLSFSSQKENLDLEYPLSVKTLTDSTMLCKSTNMSSTSASSFLPMDMEQNRSKHQSFASSSSSSNFRSEAEIAITPGILLYSAAIFLDILSIICYHYCFLGDCFFNTDTDENNGADFWGAPCTGDFWLFAEAGINQFINYGNFWFALTTLLLNCLGIALIYFGLWVHVTRYFLFFFNDYIEFDEHEHDDSQESLGLTVKKQRADQIFFRFLRKKYFQILALLWSLIFIILCTSFSILTHKCITYSSDFYCKSNNCQYISNVCAQAILSKNSDHFNLAGVKIIDTWTGWSLGFGWAGLVLNFCSIVIYFVLWENQRRSEKCQKKKNKLFWEESNHLMSGKLERISRKEYIKSQKNFQKLQDKKREKLKASISHQTGLVDCLETKHNNNQLKSQKYIESGDLNSPILHVGVSKVNVGIGDKSHRSVKNQTKEAINKIFRNLSQYRKSNLNEEQQVVYHI